MHFFPIRRSLKCFGVFSWLLLTVALLGIFASPSAVSAQVVLSVTIAPPALPVYAQPVCPGEGYIWTPGYWSYSDDGGYFWVPGTWVEPPTVGLLWTPGYWGWSNGAYLWNAGYWGPQVGFYGGINYGFGYIGTGYAGGYWTGGHFFYNTRVNNVNVHVVRNVYQKTVVVHTSHVSYNGGHGGINARPSAAQERFAHEQHTALTAAQEHHVTEARSDRSQFASVNHGRPAVVATARPGEFKSPGVVQTKASPSDRVTTSRPEVKSEPKPRAETTTRSESKPRTEPKTEAAPRTEPKAATTREPRPEATPKTTSKPAVTHEPKPEAKPKTESKPTATHEPKPEAKPKTESKPAPTHEPKAEAKPRTESKPAATHEPKPEANPSRSRDQPRRMNPNQRPNPSRSRSQLPRTNRNRKPNPGRSLNQPRHMNRSRPRSMSPRRAKKKNRSISLTPTPVRSRAMPMVACGTRDVTVEISSRDTRLTLEEQDANDIADHPSRADFGCVTDVAVFRWMGILSERGPGTASTDRTDFGRARETLRRNA